MPATGDGEEGSGPAARPLAITLGYRSSVGLVREHNEDSFVLRDDLGLWVVADGMGGAAAGEVASAIAVDVIARVVEAGSTLVAAIAEANQEVLRAAAVGRGRAGMGTTVVAAAFGGRDFTVAWVGDSRAYLWGGGELWQLSHDHSYVQDLVDAGLIDAEEAHFHPQRNIITRVLGGGSGTSAAPGVVTGSLRPGEGLLLCSDGLTSEVEDTAIRDVLEGDLSAEGAGQAAADRLVALALDRGGSDNVTVVLVGAPARP